MPSPRFSPTEVVVAITACLLLGAVVITAAFGLLDRFLDRREPDRIEGWWHRLLTNTHQPWTPQAWKTACDLSLERSRARRERNQ